MIENRARQHQSVEQRDRHAHRNTGSYIAQHPAGRRTVHIQHLAVASIGGWNDVRLSVNRETNVAEEAFVENLVDSVAIVNAAVGFTDDTRPRSWHRFGGQE